MDYESYESYLESLVKDGFIAEKGHPLKCRFCDSKSFKEHDEYYDEHGKEYQVSCNDCGEKLSIWAYGCWNLL
jgi:hypothetical protein